MADEEFQFYYPSSPPAPPPSPGGAQAPALARRTSGGFGAGPFGAMAFGSGGGLSIADVQEVTRNSVRVRFTGPVRLFNPADVHDGLYDRGYELSAYNAPQGFGAVHVPRVVYVERVSSTEAILYLDAVLDGPGVVYRLAGSSAQFGAVPLSSRSALFRTFGEGRLPRQQQLRPTRGGDLANVQAAGAEPGDPLELGTLSADADGDYLNDQGLVNLKKRIIRRCTTRKGAFKHAPSYGLSVPLKGLMTPARLRTLQAEAIEQIGQEPGVTQVIVTVEQPADGVVVLGLDVTANGQTFGLDLALQL